MLLLIKLGAFGWTGLGRGQLALAEQYYAGAAELLRATDRDPSRAVSSEAEFADGGARSLEVQEWPPEVTAAFELAHLGFYCQAPLEVQRHAKRLAEEFGVVSIAELADYPDRAPISVAGNVTTLRVRTTKKGEPMAWLGLSERRELRDRLAASGQYVTFSPGPNPNPNVEAELQRWLATSPGADAAAGFRAGWARLARFVGPRLRDWEARFECARRHNAGLRSHIAALLAELERLPGTKRGPGVAADYRGVPRAVACGKRRRIPLSS